MNGGSWWAAVHGVARVGHDWATLLSLFTLMHWRRKWQPTPMFLPRESGDGRAWWAAICGAAQSRTRLNWLSSSSSRELFLTSVFACGWGKYILQHIPCVLCVISETETDTRFSSVQSLIIPTLCRPMDCSTSGFPVHHQLPEPTQTHVHWVGDAIQPSRPLLSPYPSAFNLSQHQFSSVAQSCPTL